MREIHEFSYKSREPPALKPIQFANILYIDAHNHGIRRYTKMIKMDNRSPIATCYLPHLWITGGANRVVLAKNG